MPHKSFDLVVGVWKKRGPTATLQCEAAFASTPGTFAVAVAVVGVGVGGVGGVVECPLDVPWTSFGRPLDVPWTSLGRPLHVPWAPLDIPWISFGSPVDVPHCFSLGNTDANT